jgi:hypothetical protein
MNDLAALTPHPGFPDRVWVVVEQPAHEPYRLAYGPAAGTFVRTGVRSLSYARGWSGAYGWIGGLGWPPGPHFDVFLLTSGAWAAGAVVPADLCGVFYRRDGDHKLVALDAALRSTVPAADVAALTPAMQDDLYRLYSDIGPGEGWWGADEARAYLRWRARERGYLSPAEDPSQG